MRKTIPGFILVLGAASGAPLLCGQTIDSMASPMSQRIEELRRPKQPDTNPLLKNEAWVKEQKQQALGDSAAMKKLSQDLARALAELEGTNLPPQFIRQIRETAQELRQRTKKTGFLFVQVFPDPGKDTPPRLPQQSAEIAPLVALKQDAALLTNLSSQLQDGLKLRFDAPKKVSVETLEGSSIASLLKNIKSVCKDLERQADRLSSP